MRIAVQNMATVTRIIKTVVTSFNDHELPTDMELIIPEHKDINPEVDAPVSWEVRAQTLCNMLNGIRFAGQLDEKKQIRVKLVYE